MTSDLFLSYARIKDMYNGVSQFKEHLEWSLRLQTGKTNFTIFFDKNQIIAGDDFAEIIKSELEQAKGLIILYSPTWFSSNYCKREYKFFKSLNPSRPVIVLKWGEVKIESLEDEESKEIHKELAKINDYPWHINLQYGRWDTPDLKIAAAELASQVLIRLNK
jgi:hypothetical protein